MMRAFRIYVSRHAVNARNVELIPSSIWLMVNVKNSLNSLYSMKLQVHLTAVTIRHPAALWIFAVIHERRFPFAVTMWDISYFGVPSPVDTPTALNFG